MIDALLFLSVEQVISEPPASPLDGQSYLITAPTTGEWAGRDGQIAMRIGGNWQFVAPVQGMTLFDKETEQNLRFNSGWLRAAEPAIPTGGSVVDIEARAAIEALIGALRDGGVLPTE